MMSLLSGQKKISLETPEMLNFQARMYQNLNNDILGKHQSLNPYQRISYTE